MSMIRDLIQFMALYLIIFWTFLSICLVCMPQQMEFRSYWSGAKVLFGWSLGDFDLSIFDSVISVEPWIANVI